MKTRQQIIDRLIEYSKEKQQRVNLEYNIALQNNTTVYDNGKYKFNLN